MAMTQSAESVRYRPIEWRLGRHGDVISNQGLRGRGGPTLPRDPRQWSREDVSLWLKVVSKEHGLPEIAAAKFQMNGKALCLMSSDMFLARVPLGGKLLFKDFQLRLCTALYSS